MALRKIVHIDEEKCNGCGECIPSCAEGAIQLIDGKAKLVSEQYCDGLGACLGTCPQGAITVEEREANEFDEEATREHLERLRAKKNDDAVSKTEQSQERHGDNGSAHAHVAHAHGGGCPSAMTLDLREERQQRTTRPAVPAHPVSPPPHTGLSNWPVQLHLVPPSAPYLKDNDVVLAADCVAFACPTFHESILGDKAMLIGCPKLDNAEFYVNKLAQIIEQGGVRSLTIAIMEVPCCKGLVEIARQARAKAKSDIPLSEIVVSVRGEIISARMGVDRP